MSFKNFNQKITRRKLLTLGGIAFLSNAIAPSFSAIHPLDAILQEKNCSIVLYDIQQKHPIIINNDLLSNQRIPIGSLGKLISTIAFFNTGIPIEGKSYRCNGYDYFDKKKVNCWKSGGHGDLTIERAIGHSCNLFFQHFSKNLSPHLLLATYNNILDEIKSPKASQSSFRLAKSSLNHPIYNLCIGHDERFSLSPTEVATLMALLATEKIMSVTNRTAYTAIKNGMILGAKEGTSHLLGQNNLIVAAKTGTIKDVNGIYSGWIGGYYPITSPRISFCIMIHNGTATSNAVPLAAKVLKACQNIL